MTFENLKNKFDTIQIAGKDLKDQLEELELLRKILTPDGVKGSGLIIIVDAINSFQNAPDETAAFQSLMFIKNIREEEIIDSYQNNREKIRGNTNFTEWLKKHRFTLTNTVIKVARPDLAQHNLKILRELKAGARNILHDTGNFDENYILSKE